MAGSDSTEGPSVDSNLASNFHFVDDEVQNLLSIKLAVIRVDTLDVSLG